MKTIKTPAFRRKAVILLAVGLVLAVLAGWRQQRTLSVWLVDCSFMVGLVFLCVGCWEQLNNMKAFSATGWGIRRIQRMVSRSKYETEDEKKAPKDFQSYVANKPHHDDAVPLMAVGGVLLVLSLLLSIPFVA